MELDSLNPTQPTVTLYSLDSYTFGIKEPQYEKDRSVKDRLASLADKYSKEGMRQHVEGLMLVHNHGLPGGHLKPGEDICEGLKRKLTKKLAPKIHEYGPDWQIGELVASWWRPNFETHLFPYIPPHITKPKEVKKQFIVLLPDKGILAVPKNFKLLAVPLFELYDNAARYGPMLAALPQELSRFNFVFH